MLGLSYRYILTREVDSAHSTMALMSNAIVFQCVPEAMHAFRVSSTIPSHCGAGGINKCSIGISLAPHRAARRQTTIPVNSASHCTSSFTTFKAAANYDGLPVTQIVRRGTGPILVNCHPRLRQATRLSTGSKITDSSAPLHRTDATCRVDMFLCCSHRDSLPLRRMRRYGSLPNLADQIEVIAPDRLFFVAVASADTIKWVHHTASMGQVRCVGLLVHRKKTETLTMA